MPTPPVVVLPAESHILQISRTRKAADRLAVDSLAQGDEQVLFELHLESGERPLMTPGTMLRRGIRMVTYVRSNGEKTRVKVGDRTR